MENRQWKFIIVDMEDGSIVGTDDQKVASEFAQNDQNFVVNMSSCAVMVATEGGEGEDVVITEENIIEQQLYKF